MTESSRAERLEMLLERMSSLAASNRAAFIARETGDDPELHADLARLSQEPHAAA